MLVLARKKNESIVIDKDITVRVLNIRGNQVKLGVEAPKEVPVLRQEVHERNKGLSGGEIPGKPAQYRNNTDMGLGLVCYDGMHDLRNEWRDIRYC